MEDYAEDLIESNDQIVFEEVVGENIVVNGHDEEIIIENGYQEDEIDVCNEDEDNDDYIINNNYTYDINGINNNVEVDIEQTNINDYNQIDYYSSDNKCQQNVEKSHELHNNNYINHHNDIVSDNIEIENDSDNNGERIINNTKYINNEENNIDNNYVCDDKISKTWQNNDFDSSNIVEVYNPKTSSNLISNFKLKHRKTNLISKNSFQNYNNMKGVKIIWQRRNKPLNSVRPKQLQNMNEFNQSYSKQNFSLKKNRAKCMNSSDNESDVRRNRGRPRRGEFVPPVFKVTDCQPLDIAAHLNLLSNSLTNIGSRLIIEKGEVSVNDCVSVLMDSLICVLCSLLPLTSQIEPMKIHAQKMKERHLELLDNIAYIMPGVTK